MRVRAGCGWDAELHAVSNRAPASAVVDGGVAEVRGRAERPVSRFIRDAAAVHRQVAPRTPRDAQPDDSRVR